MALLRQNQRIAKIVCVLGMALCWYCKSPGNESKSPKLILLKVNSLKVSPCTGYRQRRSCRNPSLRSDLSKFARLFGELMGCSALDLSETYVSTQRSS